MKDGTGRKERGNDNKTEKGKIRKRIGMMCITIVAYTLV